MINRDKYNEIYLKLRSAYDIYLKTQQDSSNLSESKESSFEMAAYDAEIAVIMLLRSWADVEGIDLEGKVFPEVRVLYNILTKQSNKLTAITIRSNIGVISSWHSEYGMLLGSGNDPRKKATSDEACQEVIRAASRIFNYFDRYFVEE